MKDNACRGEVFCWLISVERYHATLEKLNSHVKLHRVRFCQQICILYPWVAAKATGRDL